MSTTIGPAQGQPLTLYSARAAGLERPLMGIQVGDDAKALFTKDGSIELLVTIGEFWSLDVLVSDDAADIVEARVLCRCGFQRAAHRPHAPAYICQHFEAA